MENGRVEPTVATENVRSESAHGVESETNSDVESELRNSGIVIGAEFDFRRSPLRRLLGHWGEHHVKYTSAATFLGIIFAFWQLSLSVAQFEQQMEEQRKSTSSRLVSDFFKQVGDMAALHSPRGQEEQGNQLEIERFIVSRAQMLLDSQQTTDYRNEIVRFLGSNGYGPLFGSKPGLESPGINLNGASLRAIRIYGADFSDSNFYCVGFEGANIDKTNFINSDINNSDFSGAEIGLANFSKARLRKVHFNDATLIGVPSFEDASIVLSDLTGLRVSASLAQARAEASGDSSVAGVQSASYRYLAELLAKARTLFGTKMDPRLDAALAEQLGPELYQAIVQTPYGSDARIIDAKAIPDDLDYRARCRSPQVGDA